MKGIRTCYLSLGLAMALAAPAFAQQTVLRYRAILDLPGTIEARIVSMDPTNPLPDVPKEKRYFLHLEQPLAVTAGEGGDKTMNPDEKGVTELQLMSNLPPEANIGPALQEAADKNIRVILNGALFHASTKQHYTKVLMEVAAVKVAPLPVQQPIQEEPSQAEALTTSLQTSGEIPPPPKAPPVLPSSQAPISLR